MKRVIQLLTVVVAAFVAVPADAGGFNPAMIMHMVGPAMQMMHPRGGERGRVMYGPGPGYRAGGFRRYFVERPRVVQGGGVVGGYDGVVGGGEYGGGGTRIETFHYHTERFRHFEGGAERQVAIAPAPVEQRPCYRPHHRVRIHYARPAPRPSCDCCCCGCRENAATVVRYRSTPEYDQPSEVQPDPLPPASSRELTQEDVELLRSVYK